MDTIIRSILRATVTGVLAAGLVLPVTPALHAQLQTRPDAATLPQPLQPAEAFRVQHFTAADGLPSNEVFAIEEDALGFLWLGTSNGLVRYDGYTFETFLPRPGDSTSIGGRHIIALHVDTGGDLWVGGGYADPGGFSRFDRATERFTRYQYDPNNSNSLLNDEVTTITSSHDEPGVLWIGTRDDPGQASGLSRLDVATGTFTHYTTEDGLDNNIVWEVFVDREGTLWVGTAGGGLNRFDPSTGRFTSFFPYDGAGEVIAIYEDRAGVLWVGAYGAGLSRFDRETETFTSFPAQPGVEGMRVILEDHAGTLWIATENGLYTFDRETERFTRFPNQPAAFNVWSLHEDRFGVLWAGAFFGGGLLKVERWFNPFTVYRHDPDDPNSLADDRVRAILEDRRGALWIGGGGWLNRVDRTKGTVTRYRQATSGIYEDRAGARWVGGFTSGLYWMDHDRPGGFTRFQHDPDDPNTIGPGFVQALLEDQAGNFWIPLFLGGIDRMDREMGTFTHYTSASHGLGDDRLLRLYEAPSEPGILWAGTSAGLSRFDTETERFTNYHTEPLRQSMMMHEDRQGRFWVATTGSGLHLFDRETGTIEQIFTTEDGLAHNVVWSIYEDDQGFLWLSTDNGLSKFDPETQAFRNYYARDGLPGSIFSENAHHQSSSGELFFGGPNGAVSFFPEDLVDNPVPPEMVLTGLRIDERPVEIGSNSPLGASMTVTEAVTLSHTQNDLTFEYVGLHFIDPAQNQYRYMLEGYDGAWVEAGEQRTARYTNLDPGTYVFRVTARNGDGPWNEADASVRLTILPPWWRTTWAYLLYGLLFALGVFAVDRVQRRRLLRKERERTLQREREQAREIERAYGQLEQAHTELEQTHQHLKATQNQLIQQEKMASLGQMTAGIAHEIKNPLNFVNNFSELSVELADDLEAALANGDNVSVLLSHLKRNAASINHHGRRADAIVQSMMQHASGGTGERRAVAVNALVEEYVNLAYHGMRAQRLDFNVEIERAYDEAAGEVEMVPQEMGRVLLNLLSNAFYAVDEKADAERERRGDTETGYAPTVTVTTRRHGEAVEIRIGDNGPGIHKELREKIFEPFYTTKPPGSGNTGLGLSLSYEIVVQGHGGRLAVESEEGKGATFVITLPTARS